MEVETKQEQDALDDPDDEEEDDAGSGTAHVPLDVPQAEDDEMKAIGPRQDTQAEQESEFLDSLKMVGFPKDEEKRRQAWMELPRET